MSFARGAAVLALVAGCGRYGFSDEGGPDAPPPIDAVEPAPNHLTCFAPARFPIDADSTTRLRAIGTDAGYEVFAVTGDGAVRGFAYEFTADGSEHLVARAENAVLGADSSSSIGAALVGDRTLLAQVYGSPAAGTALLPLGPQLSTAGTSSRRDGEFATDAPLARSGISDALGYLTVTMAGEVNLRLVTPAGADASGAEPIVDPSEQVGDPAIASGGRGFLVTWIHNEGAPNVTRAALVDESRAIVAGPIDVGDPVAHPDDEGAARGAWAASSQRYLIAWYQKTDGSSGSDRIWFSILDASLTALVPPTILSPDGIYPKVVSDGTDFVVAWESAAEPAHVGAARVSADGTFRKVAVTSSGGVFADWSLAVHAGQPALVWAEHAGTGKPLWFDPLCE